MEPGTLVIALACQDFLYEKMVSNIQEIKARGAYVLAVAKEGNDAIAAQSDKMVYIPECRDEISASHKRSTAAAFRILCSQGERLQHR